MTNIFKVALYIRVSTERQANEGDSLEEQETELKKYCDFRQFSIHQIYIERGKSGGNTKRCVSSPDRLTDRGCHVHKTHPFLIAQRVPIELSCPPPTLELRGK